MEKKTSKTGARGGQGRPLDISVTSTVVPWRAGGAMPKDAATKAKRRRLKEAREAEEAALALLEVGAGAD